MSKHAFIEKFRELLPFVKNQFVQASLKIALDDYEKNNRPPRHVFVRDPRNLCVHGNPLGADCGPCIESYGNAQPVMGTWKDERLTQD